MSEGRKWIFCIAYQKKINPVKTRVSSRLHDFFKNKTKNVFLVPK